MLYGKGSPISISSKQKINTWSSTEAKLVGVNNALGMILWVQNFIQAQGYSVTDNVIFQDNLCAMLLENNAMEDSHWGRRQGTLR